MVSPHRRSASLPHSLPQIEEEDQNEPIRRNIDRTLGLDATRQPRNAFAEEGLRVHRHRLVSNAFYQEQFSQRKNTPPHMMHPALRNDSPIYDISQPLPELDSEMDRRRPSCEMVQISPQRARGSNTTTMSPFINASDWDRPKSPELWLEPPPDPSQVPTMRNQLEERQQDSADNHITVTRYSPKVTSRDFGNRSQQTQGTGAKRSSTSPKRSLLDRFRASNRRGAVPLQSLPSEGSFNMPAKAHAVLVSTPPRRSLGRSPSKNKSFWSRNKPSVSEEDGYTVPVPALKEPPRAAHSMSGRHELPGYSRSQSLGWRENAIPPTPPAKDTPPDEKAKLESAEEFITSLESDTPTRQTGLLSTTDRFSPTKNGGYARRNNATLVPQASTRSLRASFVRGTMGEQEHEEIRTRIDALGLEGLSLAHDNHRHEDATTYSPSVYSPEMGKDWYDTFTPTASYKQHKKSKSASFTNAPNMGSISIVYPELARDPSMMTIDTPPSKTIEASYADYLRTERKPTIRCGGLGVVIDEVDGMLQSGEGSPGSLFAAPFGRCASAQVSPLHPQPPTFANRENRPVVHDLQPDRNCQQTLPDLQPPIFNACGQQVLPATTYNPWDIQQQSNHSPSNETRLSSSSGSRLRDKKSTAVMPGLEYDSGVDVDPKKMLARISASSKNSRISSKSRSSPARREKGLARAESLTNIPEAAPLNTAQGLGTRDSSSKDVIASYQHKDINKRLSDLEDTVKQDALQRNQSELEDKRLFEQQVLHDHRIASLEIERFSRGPSPTNCYREDDGWHSPRKTSSSPSHLVVSPKQSRHRSSAQSPDDRSTHKRISTGEAKDFYQNQLRDSPVMNSGNVETFGKAHLSRTSPISSKASRPHAPDVPAPSNEQEIIRQLQLQVDRQNEWMQSTMARVAAIEAKFGRKQGEGN